MGKHKSMSPAKDWLGRPRGRPRPVRREERPVETRSQLRQQIHELRRDCVAVMAEHRAFDRHLAGVPPSDARVKAEQELNNHLSGETTMRWTRYGLAREVRLRRRYLAEAAAELDARVEMTSDITLSGDSVADQPDASSLATPRLYPDDPAAAAAAVDEASRAQPSGDEQAAPEDLASHSASLLVAQGREQHTRFLAQLAQAREEHRAELAATRAELAATRAEHRAHIEVVEKQLAQAREEYLAELAAARTEHRAHLEAVEQRHLEQLAALLGPDEAEPPAPSVGAGSRLDPTSEAFEFASGDLSPSEDDDVAPELVPVDEPVAGNAPVVWRPLAMDRVAQETRLSGSPQLRAPRPTWTDTGSGQPVQMDAPNRALPADSRPGRADREQWWRVPRTVRQAAVVIGEQQSDAVPAPPMIEVPDAAGVGSD